MKAMMKIKKKLCTGCNSEEYIWKNDKGSRYCKSCWYKLKEEKPSIKKVSVKKSQEDAVYSKLRKDYLCSRPFCQASIPGKCTTNATDVHHKKGRGKYYLITPTWLAVCRSCHEWIETHPEQAKELGYSESRHD
jgi:hypothetical protein